MSTDRQAAVILFSSEVAEEARAIAGRYPEKRSAVLPLLHLAQGRLGHICDGVIDWVARLAEVPPVEVLGVVTFYPAFRREPAGGRVVRVCGTLSCALRGAAETTAALERGLGTPCGRTSAEGVTLERVECLGACDKAPAVQVDRMLFENVTADKAGELAERVRASLADENYGRGAVAPGTPEWHG